MSKNNESWQKIYEDLKIFKHDFKKEPFYLSAEQIKLCVKDFQKTSQKEVRVLCKQDSREDRPQVFIDNDLFILPIKNGEYILCKGEGYVNIPNIETKTISYKSKLDFELKSASVGDSEMQHLDFAYASSLIRTFMQDESLVLSIRGANTRQNLISIPSFIKISELSLSKLKWIAVLRAEKKLF